MRGKRGQQDGCYLARKVTPRRERLLWKSFSERFGIASKDVFAVAAAFVAASAIPSNTHGKDTDNAFRSSH
jgi:hypothetical protein